MNRLLSFVLAAGLLVLSQASANGQTNTVTVTVHEVLSKTNADGGGDDDIYAKIVIDPTAGTGRGETASCNFIRAHRDGFEHDFPNWVCTTEVEGADPVLLVTLQLWEHDGGWFTGSDDHFDVHPLPDKKDIVMSFRPNGNRLTINDIPGFADADGQCALGGLSFEGFDGDDQAKVVFSVSSSQDGTVDGDTDGDSLLDSWETCGVEGIDLVGLGADPLHKDLFVEVDWMIDNDGTADDHSHEPWLPALINAINEFNALPNAIVANPDGANGISLRIDVGNLYGGYNVDFNGQAPPEIDMVSSGIDIDGDGTNESWDVDGDGKPDIGMLGALGAGTPGGGNAMTEVLSLSKNDDDSFFGSGSGFRRLKSRNFDPARNLVFHYSIFGHTYQDANRSSGLAECGLFGPSPCNDFIVSLGTWPRQTLRPMIFLGTGMPDDTTDLDMNGAPDALDTDGDGSIDLLLGPGGLPVDGTIRAHTGTFLHELGHTLSLPHGIRQRPSGTQSPTNCGPNYLSVMSYTWQISGIFFDFTGDPPPQAIPDVVAVDFDNDTRADPSRYIFSPNAFNPLNEAALNEAVGVSPAGPPNALIQFGPAINDFDGDMINDLPLVATNAPVDWNQDGVVTVAPGTVVADINNLGISGCQATSNETFIGINDLQFMVNQGLNLRARADLFPGLTRDAQEQLDRSQVKLVKLSGADHLSRSCEASKTITFEEQAAGTEINRQYMPLAVFLRDGLRKPKIFGDAERGGAPTHSAPGSLVNLPGIQNGNPQSLVVYFPTPVRMFGLYLGRARPLGGDIPLDQVFVSAYDNGGALLGELEHEIPLTSPGITEFLGVASRFPDKLISRAVLRYAGTAAGEPVHIDDLTLCYRKTEPTKVPSPYGKIPGGQSMTLDVNAVAVLQGATVDDGSGSGHRELRTLPLNGVPVDVDGVAETMTGFSLARPRSQRVELSAPDAFTALGRHLSFSYWILDDRIHFSEGRRRISFNARNGVLTAVYVDLDSFDRPGDFRVPPGSTVPPGFRVPPGFDHPGSCFDRDICERIKRCFFGTPCGGPCTKRGVCQ